MSQSFSLGHIAITPGALAAVLQGDAVAYGREMMGLPLVITATDIRDRFYLHVTIDPSLSVPANKRALLETLLGLDYTASLARSGASAASG
jgi:hypothetical protein